MKKLSSLFVKSEIKRQIVNAHVNLEEKMMIKSPSYQKHTEEKLEMRKLVASLVRVHNFQ